MIINIKSSNYKYDNINHSRKFAAVQWSICILRHYNFEATDKILLPEAAIFRCGWCHSNRRSPQLVLWPQGFQNLRYYYAICELHLIVFPNGTDTIHFIGCFYLDSSSHVQPICIYLLNGKVFPDFKSYYDMGLNFCETEQ